MSSGPNTPTFPPNPTPFGFGFTNIDEKMELGISSNVESGKDEIEDEIEDFTPSEGRPTSINECREIERLYDAVNVILSYQVHHQASVCPLRLVAYRFCGVMVQAGSSSIDVRDRMRGLSEHESICRSRMAPCDSCGCSVML